MGRALEQSVVTFGDELDPPGDGRDAGGNVRAGGEHSSRPWLRPRHVASASWLWLGESQMEGSSTRPRKTTVPVVPSRMRKM